ncbi:MAG: ABC transporter substrate-binding protein [Candidatus Eremiobacteraeota bacterium]|nr:ABC transporter substrate-binding protein [Candidatus Eremiobacteraeota bacterium]
MRARAWAALLALVVVQACAPQQRSQPAAHEGAASERPRVVSLAPSLTEIAYAIGCQDVLVAGTTYDDYPPAARALPHVADLSAVDLERLSALHPTIVVALHDQEREGAPVESRLSIPVMYLPNRNLADLYADIAGVGAACGKPAAAAHLSRALHARIDAIARMTHPKPKPRVFFLLDLPGFTAGATSFIDDLIRLSGGVNVAGGVKAAYPAISTEALVQMDPDVLIVAREVPFGPSVLGAEPWRSLKAVQEGRVVRPPSDDIVERNGPRVVQGLAWMAAAIHSTGGIAR